MARRFIFSSKKHHVADNKPTWVLRESKTYPSSLCMYHLWSCESYDLQWKTVWFDWTWSKK